MSSKKVVISSGDPAGCGPLITLKAIESLHKRKIDFYVAGSRDIYSRYPLYEKVKNRINWIDVDAVRVKDIKAGIGSILSGEAALEYLSVSLEFMKLKSLDCLVTAPLSKEAVQLKNPGFRGHTEYLGRFFKAGNIAMLMYSERIKTVLMTRHMPFSEVSRKINKKLVRDTALLVISFLRKRLKVKSPRIAFASLNPHAGVDTFMGREERIIASGIKGIKEASGPFPADTLYTPSKLSKYDCFVSPYHDQGMIPFKLLSFREGVNVTLGLPVIRTSPAHGVAYDVMCRNKQPFFSSMKAAIELAVKLSGGN
ncbi:MAG: hypothetical protein GF375_01215 [Candidatus Omnitrophica bacterium]|nr:hypothetical protein [Candidatus Omnitrophota bacterium]MBD3268752.1 hypothetical protein [Candidatus Omnitrophota bacterium]